MFISVFAKFQGLAIFQILRIIFLKKNPVEYIHGVVSRVHGGQSMGPWTSSK
jgi:hypothetical protein